MPSKADPNDIRTLFSSAISDMYRSEVPQYGDLINLVKDVNNEVLKKNPALKAKMKRDGNLDRLNIERHGAIRLGSAKELFNTRRLFAVMGMFPVSYYDLSIAGLPVHSTAFRPITTSALNRNPFRVFTSLLRLELIEDRQLAQQAEQLLSNRQIITQRALELINTAETRDGLSMSEATEFVYEAIETFRWHSDTTVSSNTYNQLNNVHSLVADVVCFQGPHINHLTPRTLDIETIQKKMPTRGMSPKATIEGPPQRNTALLLRQTSFKALQEKVFFTDENGVKIEGSHTARFGEIEQRGIALTTKGRQLYDQLLDTTLEQSHKKKSVYSEELTTQFRSFPDTFEELRQQRLAFFTYHQTSKHSLHESAKSIEELIQSGALAYSPQTYEDFLPVSAAGIFRSNLSSNAQSHYSQESNQKTFEKALGVEVINEQKLYERSQRNSLENALVGLGQEHLIRSIASYLY